MASALRPDLLRTALQRAALQLPADASSEAVILEAMRSVDSLRPEDRAGVHAELASLAAPVVPLLPPGMSMERWIMAAGTVSQGEGEPGIVVRLPELVLP